MGILKSVIPSREYRRNIEMEVLPYNMSLKALALGYQDAFMGRFLLHLRYIEWYETHKENVLCRILGGGKLVLLSSMRTKDWISNTSVYLRLRHKVLSLGMVYCQ